MRIAAPRGAHIKLLLDISKEQLSRILAIQATPSVYEIVRLRYRQNSHRYKTVYEKLCYIYSKEKGDSTDRPADGEFVMFVEVLLGSTSGIVALPVCCQSEFKWIEWRDLMCEIVKSERKLRRDTSRRGREHYCRRGEGRN